MVPISISSLKYVNGNQANLTKPKCKKKQNNLVGQLLPKGVMDFDPLFSFEQKSSFVLDQEKQTSRDQQLDILITLTIALSDDIFKATPAPFVQTYTFLNSNCVENLKDVVDFTR